MSQVPPTNQRLKWLTISVLLLSKQQCISHYLYIYIKKPACKYQLLSLESCISKGTRSYNPNMQRITFYCLGRHLFLINAVTWLQFLNVLKRHQSHHGFPFLLIYAYVLYDMSYNCPFSVLLHLLKNQLKFTEEDVALNKNTSIVWINRKWEL